MYENIQLDKEAIISQALSIIDPQYEQRTEKYLLKSRRDLRYTLDFTLEALIIKQKSILINYYKWLIETLARYQISEKTLLKMFDSLQDLLLPYLNQTDQVIIKSITKEDILNNLKQPVKRLALNEESQAYLDLLLKKDRKEAFSYIQSKAKNRESINHIYLDIIQPAMEEIGYLWQYRLINVADEHLATVITQYVMSGLYPFIFDTPKHGKKLVALALGDELHEIGIRMVADLFEYAGFQTTYLGANMPTSSIIDHALKYQPDLLAVSITLGNHLSKLTTLMDSLRNHPALRNLKVMIGGQAVAKIPDAVAIFKADGFAFDGQSAVKVGEQLVGI